MPWARFDDHFPAHRKVRGLSDSAFRLHVEAICWCAANLTDGFVPASDLLDMATARRPLKFVPELVIRRSWHLADEVCDSKKCPAHPASTPHKPLGDGWLIHDYFEYQPTRAKALEEKAKNAARQQRFRDRQKGLEPDSESNAVSNAVTTSVSNRPPSRPVYRGVAVDEQLTGSSQSVRAGAHAREAHRWLANEFRGLTDDEAASTWHEIVRRTPGDIRHPIGLLRRMLDNGTLIDILEAVQQASQPLLYAVPDPDEPLPPLPPDPDAEPGPAPMPAEKSRALAHASTCKKPRCERCADIHERWPDLRRSGT